MAWRIRGLLGAATLVVLTSCGVTEDEAVRLKEGQTLGEPEHCSTRGCPYEGQMQLCLEVFFEDGRSPAQCLPVNVCELLECQKEGGYCVIFDGFPGQVKCIRD